MTESTIRWEQDADHIVTLILDDPQQSANTMNERYMRSMEETVSRLEKEKDDIAGVIITSAKSTFFAGGDLRDLAKVTKENAPEFAKGVEAGKAQLRRLETLGKPVVAALNGTALGGGLEIALACHHRVALNNPKAQFGFPEVTLGLLPGAGGVVRTVRMLGIQNALMQVLMQGQRLKVEKAKSVGIIDDIADSEDDMLAKARAWIKANPKAKQPWDEKGYKIPGGTPSTPAFAQNLPAFPANLRKQLKGANYPAPRNIMAAAVEGAQVGFDDALTIEGRYFVELARGQVAKNMINAFFFNLQAINAGASRPKGVPKYKAEKVAVLGAGMMGAGIAYVTARSGAQVVLKDVSIENAEKGKAYSEKLLDKEVSKGKMSQEKKEEILARITPAADAKDLEGVDFVIEAVFENTELKHKVFQEIEDVVNPDAVLGSNTSTLPITGLAEGVKKQDNFIGIHFFSPVDKMKLVEIIRGKQTDDETVARAYDYVQALGKLPIVVNDSRGFYTSRTFGTFVMEGAAMLGEGIPAPVIENASMQAGMPVGPLAVLDETALSLSVHVLDQTRADLHAEGKVFEATPGELLVERMVKELNRAGRAAGGGFYDYPAGQKKALWPELKPLFEKPGHAWDLQEVKDRLLYRQAVETARCLAEGVLTTVHDGNIGSIFGIGFPAWTGGALQFIYGMGIDAFEARCAQLAHKFGAGFALSEPVKNAIRQHQPTY